MTVILDNIPFYPNRLRCIAEYEENSWTAEAISHIKSWGTLCQYGWNRLFRSAMKKEHTDFSNVDTRVQKLVVCIHGLNNSPAQFNSLVNNLGHQENMAIYTPEVLKKGNEKLDAMVQPILQNIKTWAADGDEEKELYLVGISNGGRIERAIDAELAKAGGKKIKKIHFISIVGACKGSSLANLANTLHLGWLFLSKNIGAEMPINSTRFKKLNKEWEYSVNQDFSKERDYTFIAAPHDWQVPDFESTLMKVNHSRKARYAIVKDHGHNSVVDRVSKAVAQIIKGA